MLPREILYCHLQIIWTKSLPRKNKIFTFRELGPNLSQGQIKFTLLENWDQISPEEILDLHFYIIVTKSLPKVPSFQATSEVIELGIMSPKTVDHLTNITML